MEQSDGMAAGQAALGEQDPAMAEEPIASSGDAHPAHRLLPTISGREPIAMAWLAGLMVFLTAASIKAGRMMRWLMKEREEWPPALQSEIDEFLRSLGGPRALRSWLIRSGGQPFVWGLWRGDIYLPAGFASLGDSQHRRDILAHELSHVLRLDAAVNVLQILAQAIFWFHPLVWWANTKIRQEREKCCDEMAIARLGAKPRSYSRAIIEALLVEHRSNELLPSLAIAGPAKNVEERIKTILQPGKRFYRRPSLLAAACTLILALLVVPTTLALTNRPADKAQEVTAKPTAEQIEQQRTISAEKLARFVLRLTTFADAHGGRYPQPNEISWVSEEDPNTFDTFLLERAEYLGTGKTRPETGASAMPLAFDIPLLRIAGGTNVVFADGHVEFITTDRLAARGITIRKVSLEATDVRFEPVHQGKNIVYVTIKNTSNEEQLFAAHIYTRSPDYGVSDPDPDKGGVGWGTSGYFDTLKPKEAREVRLVFKIQGPVTDRTYVNLRFSNPETEETYDGKWHFYDRKYMSAELPKAKADNVVQERASSADAQAITQAFNQIQRYIQDGQYEQAWERFSKDYQMAEYQRYGLAWFRRAMEPTHPMHSAFTWERGEFLKLTPGQAVKHNGVLALAPIQA
jgi:prepilin-type processing-associated H-X9-DG protein